MVYTNSYCKQAFGVIVKNENNEVVFGYGPCATKNAAEDIARRAPRFRGTTNEHFEVVRYDKIPSGVPKALI